MSNVIGIDLTSTQTSPFTDVTTLYGTRPSSCVTSACFRPMKRLIENTSAKDGATKQEQKITISGSSGLSKEDVDRMVRDAEAHAAEVAINALRDVTKGDTVDAIRRATAELERVSHAMAEQLDKQSGANAAHAAASQNNPVDDAKEGEGVDA